MSLYEAVTHALTVISTGGFGTESTSIGGFSAYTQWVITGFMVIGASSFILHIRGLRDPGEYRKKPQFRYYLMSLLAGVLLVMIGLFLEGTGVPVRESVFTAISMITGTGYFVTDYAVWPAAHPERDPHDDVHGRDVRFDNRRTQDLSGSDHPEVGSQRSAPFDPTARDLDYEVRQDRLAARGGFKCAHVRGRVHRCFLGGNRPLALFPKRLGNGDGSS